MLQLLKILEGTWWKRFGGRHEESVGKKAFSCKLLEGNFFRKLLTRLGTWDLCLVGRGIVRSDFLRDATSEGMTSATIQVKKIKTPQKQNNEYILHQQLLHQKYQRTSSLAHLPHNPPFQISPLGLLDFFLKHHLNTALYQLTGLCGML